MTKKKFFIFLIIFIFRFAMISALEYSVDINSPPHINVYEGEISTNDFSATITNNGGICDITCGWTTTADSDSGIDVESETISDPFNFKVKVEGTYRLIISCDRIEKWNCWSDPDTRTYPLGGGSYQFTYLYNGDNICTTSKEDCVSASLDCPCSSGKKCINKIDNYDNRGTDERNCATYCGNNKVESQYENCSNCQIDVGKCNGINCLSGSECEGGYCVHEKCYDKPYKQGDGFCDFGSSENCKNSPTDCSCEKNERCGSSGICETYCGNNICEESEHGICKSDCKWCGDGECSNNENCGSCETDCGLCESLELNEEIINKTKSVIQKGLSESSKKQKIISYGALGLIAIFLIIYFYLKIHKHRKRDGKKK